MRSVSRVESIVAAALAAALLAAAGCARRDAAADSAELESALATAEQSAAATETKIQRLEDFDDIENLSGAYSFYVDKSRHDDVADLFTHDGVVEILGRGVFLGEDRVRQYMRNLSPIGPRDGALFNHMKLQPVIHIAPDGMSAQMRARLFVMFGIYQTDAQWGSGIYVISSSRKMGSGSSSSCTAIKRSTRTTATVGRRSPRPFLRRTTGCHRIGRNPCRTTRIQRLSCRRSTMSIPSLDAPIITQIPD
jgi:SnoaL-like domain